MWLSTAFLLIFHHKRIIIFEPGPILEANIQHSSCVRILLPFMASNVVGMTGGVASIEEGEGLKLRLPAASIHKGSIYKMTQAAGKGEEQIIWQIYRIAGNFHFHA